MTNHTVSSGQTSSGLSLNSGDTVFAEAGGIAIGTAVNSGSEARVGISGTVSSTVINVGGALDVSGGISLDTTVNRGGVEVVEQSTQAVPGFPGIARTTTINSGGLLVNYTSAVDAVIQNGGVFLNRSLADGTIVRSGGALLNSGTAEGTVVNSGGYLISLPGSVQSGTTGEIISTGVVRFQLLTGATYYGTSAAGVLVSAPQFGIGFSNEPVVSAALYVLASGTATGTLVASGSEMGVYSGGAAIDTTVSSHGHFTVFSGGTASGTTVYDGGNMSVLGGATAADTNLSFVMDVDGTALRTIIRSGGQEAVSGTSIDAIISSGGTQAVAGMVSGTVVSSGGVEDVYGSAFGTTVSAGGLMDVIGSTGAATDTLLGSRGVLMVAGNVSGSAAVSDTTVTSGGREIVSSGGVAVGTTINSGGLAAVDSGGEVSATTVSAGGILVVLPGGMESGTTGTVASGGVVLYQGAAGFSLFGSSATSVAVSGSAGLGGGVADATLFVLSGGTANATTVGSGAEQDVYLGGSATSTVVTSGGAMNVFSGATDIGTRLEGGTGNVKSGANASSTTVNSGGTLWVSSGGTAVETAVNSGGEALNSGGVSVETLVNSGGLAFIVAGGTAAGTVINDGGEVELGDELFFFSSGLAVRTVVNSGGVEYVNADGKTNGATVNSGGAVVVDGGVAVNTTVNSGGYLVVLPNGGLVSGTTGAVISAGVVLHQGFGGVTPYSRSVSGVLLEGHASPANGSTPPLDPFFPSRPLLSAPGDTTLYVLPGGTATNTNVRSGGQLNVYSGGTADGILLGAGGIANVLSGAALEGGIVFAGSGATLAVDASDGPLLANATMSSFVVGDTIELVGLGVFAADFSLLGGNLLQVHVNSSGVFDIQLDPHRNYGGATFSYSPAADGTDITTDAACFRAGTLVRTERGDIAVEDLHIGELVALANGGYAPVRWLGHRYVDCRRHPKPHDVWPVRVAADAFADGAPHRDLYLSPDHAVFVDGALIPVRYLLNGATIAQVRAAEVPYWHVELPKHAVLLAEGLPCESYLDTGNRSAFANGEGAIALHPDFSRAIWAARSCAPLVLVGPPLARARRRLLARARALGHRRNGDPALQVVAGDAAFAVETHGAWRHVQVPAGVADIRLVFRTWVPAHARVHDPDTRKLGIALSRIWVDGREASLDSPALTLGWHAAEPGLRWTAGDASIALHGAGSLAFEVAMTGRYWQTHAPVCRSDGASRRRGTA